VCHESFFVEAPNNTWWIDSGSTIYIVNSMQGFLTTRKPASNEQRVYSGNKLFSRVEAVATFRIILKSGYVLDLENIFFIPEFSRNLIYVSKLDNVGSGFWFINSTFSIFKGEQFIGGGIKTDGLFKIDLDSNFENNYLSLHTDVGIKRSLMDQSSALLWHKRLRHISIERIKRLVNDGVLKTLDFTNLGTCVDCIKGKQTTKTTKGAKTSSEILEIIHTDICGPFPTPYLNGQRYFVAPQILIVLF
jgi:hypothetical protein